MARKSKRPPTGHTIMVVDDQEEILHSVGNLLERQGHRLLTADSGTRALELHKANNVHLFLIDYFMPCMTGADLIRELRTLDPYVQIILQTGYSGDKPASQMMAELDIQGYHDKADGPDKLLLWVDVGLKAHRLISELRERERLQGELVANVSHEFRTPLNIIGGFTDLMLQGEFGDIPGAVRQKLCRIAIATNDLSDLVSDVLQYGKLEAGVSDGIIHWLPCATLVSEIERLMGLLLEGKDVSFAVDTEGAPDGFMVDAVKLRTILRNLVSNAVKFTSCGKISLRIVGRADGVTFEVSDTGVGVALQDRDLIFEPFRQIDGSMTRQHGGIGLGLALSRRLATILGGEIGLESEPGQGSTFMLRVPPMPFDADAHSELDRLAEPVEDLSTIAAAASTA